MADQTNPDISMWRLVNGVPQRYLPASIDFEKNLEDWIDYDPTLIMADLAIVGRQVSLDSGYLDLLGIDNLGRWAVIELKKAGVRRETVAQALDYAGCIAEMTLKEFRGLVENLLTKRGLKLASFLKQKGLDVTIFEQREIQVYVVGTSRDLNLDRVLKHTTFQGNPINVVTFDVYKNSMSEHVLLRQLSETDKNNSGTKTQSGKQTEAGDDDKLGRLFKLANNNGIGEDFRKVYEAAIKFGLYPKLYKWSIMYAPPQNKNRVLICAWVHARDDLFGVYINADAFAEFYPISIRKARQIADKPMSYHLSSAETDHFVSMMRELFGEISKRK